MAPVVPQALAVKGELPRIEVPVPRRQDEARAAMTIVDALRDQGVPQRDILVVASDLPAYEPALARAAIRRERTPTFWTQIDLVNTDLYHLLVSICALLEAPGAIPADALQTVLALGWTPPDPDDPDAWPMPEPATVAAFEGIQPTATASLGTWQDRFSDADRDARVTTLLEWLAMDHPPTPDAVEAVLEGLVERYRDHVLPTVMADAAPAHRTTETAARATVRMATLVEQVGAKYRARQDEYRYATSWEMVAGLIESIATQSPGRREHANAHAIDILEPNDVWPRRASYVVVLGLVADTWPRPTTSLIPAELRQAIMTGQQETAAIVPRPSWTAGRAADQFAEVLAAAQTGAVLLRHTRTVEGEAVPPSPLLEMVPTTEPDQGADQLLADATTPTAILDALDLPHPTDGETQ